MSIIGILVAVGISSVFSLALRYMDRDNRSLDKVKKYIGMQKEDLDTKFNDQMTRLKNEYNVDIEMNMQPFEVARWMAFEDGREVTPAELKGADRGMFVYDRNQNPVLLLSNEWAIGWITDNNPDLVLNHVPFDKKEA